MLHFDPLPVRLHCERPRLHFKPQQLLNFVFNADSDLDPAFHSNADPDTAFQSNAYQDPAFHSNADADTDPALH